MLLNCGVGENPWEFLGLQEIQTVHPKRDQPLVFIGRTDVEAETPIFWPPDVKCWLIWKDPDVGKDWRQEEKGMTEDETTQWTWVWVNSGSWWWPGRPGMLQSMELQRVRHDWVTELTDEGDILFSVFITLSVIYPYYFFPQFYWETVDIYSTVYFKMYTFITF